MPPPIVIVIFVAVLGTFLGGYLLFTRFFSKRDSGKLKDRLLERVPTEGPNSAAQPLFRVNESDQQKLIYRLLAGLKLDQRLQDLIEQAGLRWSAGRTALAMLVMAVGGFDLAWYLLPYFKPLAVLVGLVCGLLPLILLMRKKKSRMASFETQFPDALEFVSRSMRAGHAFSVSLEMLHQEFPEPLGGEFKRTFDEQNLGLPMDVPWRNWAVASR